MWGQRPPEVFSRPWAARLCVWRRAPGFPISFQEVYRRFPLSAVRSSGFQEVSSLFPKRPHSRTAATIMEPQLRPVVEHKEIGGHAAAGLRIPVRGFNRLEWQTKSRVRLTFGSHVVEAGLDFGRFQKILKRFRKVSVSSRTLAPAGSMFRNVSECFAKFQSGCPAAPPNGSENPVVEHKGIAGHEGPFSRVSTAPRARCDARQKRGPARHLPGTGPPGDTPTNLRP